MVRVSLEGKSGRHIATWKKPWNIAEITDVGFNTEYRYLLVALIRELFAWGKQKMTVRGVNDKRQENIIFSGWLEFRNKVYCLYFSH